MEYPRFVPPYICTSCYDRRRVYFFGNRDGSPIGKHGADNGVYQLFVIPCPICGGRIAQNQSKIRDSRLLAAMKWFLETECPALKELEYGHYCCAQGQGDNLRYKTDDLPGLWAHLKEQLSETNPRLQAVLENIADIKDALMIEEFNG